MTDQPRSRQSSPLTAIHNVTRGPLRVVHRVDTTGRRCFLVLLAFGVAVEAWALFPSNVESGNYASRPEASARSAVNSARNKVARDPVELSPANAFKLIDDSVVSSKPTTYRLTTVGYSS